MSLWFTSDTHFGHTNIIKYQDRPWDSVEDMDKALIENWNAVVGPKDDVYHVGDFCFPRGPDRWWPYLNGKIYMVFGNHDFRHRKRLAELAEWSGDVRYVRYKGLRFFLSHYAHRTWYQRYRGAMHLYGHWHGSGPVGLGRSMDVSVEANDYKPFHLDEVVEKLKQRPIKDVEEAREQVYDGSSL